MSGVPVLTCVPLPEECRSTLSALPCRQLRIPERIPGEDPRRAARAEARRIDRVPAREAPPHPNDDVAVRGHHYCEERRAVPAEGGSLERDSSAPVFV